MRDPGSYVSEDTSYAAAMERLVLVVQELSQSRTLEDVMAVVRRAARELTSADGATFVLRDGDQCFYAEENAISPLWKGRRFPMTACISGWVMLNATPAIIEDIYADDRIPADAYRPTFVKSLAMVPVRRSNPVAAIGNYWATNRRPTDDEVAILQALADTTSVALENTQLYAELQAKIDTLASREARIKEQRDALEVFTRALAHDLKEPVRTIRSFSEMLVSGQATEADSRELLHHVREAGDRMGMLIDTVFLYTQLDDPGAIKKERLRFDEIVEAARGNLAGLIRQRRANVTYEPLPSAVANRVHMTQVLQNLISNAVHHGGEGVSVHVGVRNQGTTCQVFVRDDGPGIAPEHQQTIFEPFKRLSRDNAHAGLGLAICQRIVELHRGQIGCESQPGKGATFHFTLPDMVMARVSPASVRRLAAPVPGQDPKLATLLLVDDRDPDILLTQAFLLGPKGMRCNLLVAHDGKEGLAAIQKARQHGGEVDLVLLDINMPVMDGFEMLELMAAEESLRRIPVVMCTGSTYERDKERARSLGAVGYLEKGAGFPPPTFSMS